MPQTLGMTYPADAKPSTTFSEPHTCVYGNSSDCAPVTTPVTQNENTTPVPIWDLLRMKEVRDVLIASWLFALIYIGLEAVWLLGSIPLFDQAALD